MGIDEKEMKATADRISKAVAAIKAVRPAYEELLVFYEKLFLAQEAAKGQLSIVPVNVSEEHARVKRAEGFPLIDRSGFNIDQGASKMLLKQICGLAAEANEILSVGAERMMDALRGGVLDKTSFFTLMLGDDDAPFKDVARDVGVDEKILAFFAYSSIRPSLYLCAEQLSSRLAEDPPWKKGYCPVCGSPPAMSALRDEGGRSLLCSFCGYEWKVSRIFCPFCENRDQKTLRYFFSEEEEDYRVDVCDKCRKYLKTIDVRKMKHPLYPLVENVSTLHLDLLAREQGFESGSPLWLQT